MSKRAANDDLNKDNFQDDRETPEERDTRNEVKLADASVLKGRKMAVPRKRANISGGAGGRPDGAPLFKGFGPMSSLPPPPDATIGGAPKPLFAGFGPTFGGSSAAASSNPFGAAAGAFGSSSTPTTAPTFGAGAGSQASPFGRPPTSSPPAGLASFGQKPPEPAAPSAITFGGASKPGLSSDSSSQSVVPAPPTKPASPFAFGAPAADSTAKGPVAFGSQKPSGSAFPSSGFSFGAKPATDSAPSESAAPFQFGAKPAPTAPTAPTAPVLPSPFGAGASQLSQNPFANAGAKQDSEDDNAENNDDDDADDGDNVENDDNDNDEGSEDEESAPAAAKPVGFASSVPSAASKGLNFMGGDTKPAGPSISFKGGVPSKPTLPTSAPKFAGFGLPPAPKTNPNAGQMTPTSTSIAVDSNKPSDQFLSDVYFLNQELLSRIQEVGPDDVVNMTPLCESYISKYKDLQAKDKSSARFAPSTAPANAQQSLFKTTTAPTQSSSATNFFTKAAASPMVQPNLPKAFNSPAPPAQAAKAPVSTPADDNEPSDATPPEVTEDGEGPGEEDETNLFWAVCKLYQIEEGKPTPHGVGTIRLNRFHKGPNEGRHRLLYRDQSVIRELRLNLFLFPLLSPKLRGPKDVGLSFLQEKDGKKELQNYIVKFRDGASAEKFVKLIEENRGSD